MVEMYMAENIENDSDSKGYQPTKLAVCGGGVKGRAYAPVIKALDETNLLSGIKDVYGSSVGAILSSMLSLGFTPKEIQTQLDSDSSPYQDAAKAHDPSVPKAGIKILRNILKDGAVFKGEKLSSDCQALMQQGGLSPNATFAQLKQLIDSGTPSPSGRPYCNLHVTATVVDKRGSYQIILDSETAPNMPIALAIRASAALPPAFRAVMITPEQMKVFTQGATAKLVQYDRGPAFHNQNGKDLGEVDLKQRVKLVDGGLVDNLPQYAIQKDSKPNDDLLSLNLRGNQYMEQKTRYKDDRLNPDNENANDAIEKKYRIEREAMEGTLERAFKYSHHIAFPPSRLLATRENTIDIPTFDVDAADFGMDSKKHQQLLYDGHAAVIKFLEGKGVDVSNVTATPTIIKPVMHANADDLIIKARDALANVGLLNMKMSEVKKLSDEARQSLRQSGEQPNEKIQEVISKTQNNFQALNQLSNEVMATIKSLDVELNQPEKDKEELKFLGVRLKQAEKSDNKYDIQHIKQEIKVLSEKVDNSEDIQFIKQQKKDLLDFDLRLKMIVKINRFEQIESASKLAGAGLVKNMVKGLWKERKVSTEISNEVLIKNTTLMLNKLDAGSIPPQVATKIQAQLSQVNETLKKLKDPKNPEEKQVKETLIELQRKLNVAEFAYGKPEDKAQDNFARASPSNTTVEKRASPMVFSASIGANRNLAAAKTVENKPEEPKPGEHKPFIGTHRK